MFSYLATVLLWYMILRKNSIGLDPYLFFFAVVLRSMGFIEKKNSGYSRYYYGARDFLNYYMNMGLVKTQSVLDSHQIKSSSYSTTVDGAWDL